MQLEIVANPADPDPIAALQCGMEHNHFFVLQDIQDITNTLECRVLCRAGGKHSQKRRVTADSLTSTRQSHQHSECRATDWFEHKPGLCLLRHVLSKMLAVLFDAHFYIVGITVARMTTCLVLAGASKGRCFLQGFLSALKDRGTRNGWVCPFFNQCSTPHCNESSRKERYGRDEHGHPLQRGLTLLLCGMGSLLNNIVDVLLQFWHGSRTSLNEGNQMVN